MSSNPEGSDARVKYTTTRISSIDSILSDPKDKAKFDKVSKDVCDALWEMDLCGAAPVIPADGKVGGNAAIKLDVNGEEWMVVSKSGKLPGVKMDVERDVVVITKYDSVKWMCEFASCEEETLPTSDTPMHYATFAAHKKLNWSQVPGAILHGHAVETVEKASKIGLPISMKETICSTREDTDVLMELFNDHPYPQHKVYIRKNHGFLVLGKDMTEALKLFREQIKPNI